jgi:hypothetical protein
MSFGSSSFSSLGRSEKGKKSRSFDDSSMIAQMHSSFPTLGFARPIAESSKEFELEFEDEEPNQELKAGSSSPPRNPEAQSRGRFSSMFRLGRDDKGKQSRSFDESSMMAQMHSSFPTLGFTRPIVESSKEFELEFEDEEPSQELKAGSSSPPSNPEAQSKGRFPAMFRLGREDKGSKSRSFDESSMMAQMHSSFPTLGFMRPTAESNKEFELEFEDEEPSQKLKASSTSNSPKGRFPALFRKKRSDMSDLSLDETPSRLSSFIDAQRSFLESPRKSSFRRGKKGSDLSNDSSDDAKDDAPHVFRPGMKRSEMVVDATTADSSPSVDPDGDGRHSRIPGVLRMSLSALKRTSDRNDSKHGSPDRNNSKHGAG